MSDGEAEYGAEEEEEEEEAHSYNTYDVTSYEQLMAWERAICGPQYASIDQMCDRLSLSNPPRTCRASWEHDRLYVHCNDCAREEGSCICVRCCLEGGHLDHDIRVSTTELGNCDCGDDALWKPSGNCPRHPGVEEHPERTQLSDRLRDVCLAVFGEAWRAILQSIDNGDEVRFKLVLQWIERFCDVCDGMRRVVVIAFIENVSFVEWVRVLQRLAGTCVERVMEVVNGFVNDPYFRTMFGAAVVANWPFLIREASRQIQNGFTDWSARPLAGLLEFAKNSFHFFDKRSIATLTQKNMISWNETVLKVLEEQIKFVMEFGACDIMLVFSDLFMEQSFSLVRLVRAAAALESERANLYDFSVHLAKVIAVLEGNITLSGMILHGRDPWEVNKAHVAFHCGLGSALPKIIQATGFCEGVYMVFMEWIKSNLLSDDASIGPLTQPVFDKTVKLTMDCSLHALAMETLLLDPHPRTTLERLCSSAEVEFEKFCRAAALLPLRWLASAYLDIVFMDDGSPNNVLGQAFERTLRFGSLKGLVMPYFSVVQFYLGLCTDKDAFLEMVCGTFGLYSDSLTAGQMDTVRDLALAFISCLLLDRSCIRRDWRSCAMQVIVYRMKEVGDITTDDAEYRIAPFTLADKRLEEQLKGVVTVRSGVVTLVDDSTWNVLMPYALKRHWITTMKQIIGQKPDELLPFPDFVPMESRECDLESAMCSKHVFSLIFDAMNSALTENPLSKHIAASLIVVCARCASARMLVEQIPVVRADSMYSLANELTHDFREFILTPISYKLGYANTIVSILHKLGKFGENVMIAGNIDRSRESSANRQEIRQLRQQVMEEFDKRTQEFEKQLANEPVKGSCAVCGNCQLDHDMMMIPIILVKTGMLQYQEEPTPQPFERKTAWIINGCCHAVHASCIENNDLWGKNYHCRICGRLRHFYIPASRNVKWPEELNWFLHHSLSEVAERITDGYSVTTRDALGNQIACLEIRYRNRPEVLSSENRRKVLMALFNCLTQDFVVSLDEERQIADTTVLGAIIAAAIDWLKKDNRDPSETWHELVELTRPFWKGDVASAILLRRVDLFAHFMLGLQLGGDRVVDWDREMDCGFLVSERFGFSVDAPIELTIPALRPIELPDNWLGLSQEPFSYDIEDFGSQRFICLVAGRVVHGENRYVKDAVPLHEYLEQEWLNTGTLMLCISGEHASTLLYFCPGQVVRMKEQIYLDKTGFPDYGFTRSEFVKIDRDKLCLAWDRFLSGKWKDESTE